MRRIIIFALLLAACAAVVHPATVTKAEVLQLIQDKGVDWAAQWITDVYNAVPTVKIPGMVCIISDLDVTVSFAQDDQGKIMPVTVNVADRLEWDINFTPWVFKGVVPAIRRTFWRDAGLVGVGVAVGVGGTLLVMMLTGHTK
jgi:hypothetical protein